MEPILTCSSRWSSLEKQWGTIPGKQMLPHSTLIDLFKYYLTMCPHKAILCVHTSHPKDFTPQPLKNSITVFLLLPVT